MKRKLNLKTNFFVLVVIFALNANFLLAQDYKTITFNAEDSVQITANLYISHPPKAPFIIFFHQAGWSRGEYLEIAPKINKLGFNAMAIDQRSGGEINGVINQTKLNAESKGKGTKYLDAIPDMKAAIFYVHKKYPKAKLIIWGSSYSSALVLKLASDYPKLINGVLAFSPAEYYVRFGKPDNYISQSAKNIECPVFITSAKSELARWKPIFAVIPSKNKVGFEPQKKGNHGSRALWESKAGNKEYWEATKKFLKIFTQIKN